MKTIINIKHLKHIFKVLNIIERVNLYLKYNKNKEQYINQI